MNNYKVTVFDKDDKTAEFVKSSLDYDVSTYRKYDPEIAEDSDLVITEVGSSGIGPKAEINAPTILHSIPWHIERWEEKRNKALRDTTERDPNYEGPGEKYHEDDLFFIEKVKGSEGMEDLCNKILE